MAINDWMRRMSTAIRAGFAAAWGTFNEQNYVPLEAYGFDEYKVRLARYWQFRLYADNTVFSTIETYRQQHKNARDLYRHIRSIYNPVSRLIDLEVAKIYGGSIDYANQLQGGAIPILGAEPALIEAMIQLFRWSNMDATKNRFARDGATYGDRTFKVIDDPAGGKVRLEVLDPRKIHNVELDAVGNVKAIHIEYTRYDPLTKRDYVYTELINGDTFATFKDHQPFAYYENASGELVPQWDNEYGFVPVRLGKHKETGDVKFGTTSFNTSLSKIDEMNDLASTIHDAIRKNVNPLWGIAGDFKMTAGNTKIPSPAEERDEQPFVKFPAGATITPMVFPLDIPGAMAALSDQVKEVEKDMPQLAIQRIREAGTTFSGVAIRGMYSDASDAIIASQGNADAALVAAIQMAVSIGGLRKYRNFEAFDLNSYAAGDLEFTIAERPVFPDEVDKQQKITLILQAADSPAMRVALKLLDVSDEDIDAIEDAKNNTEAAALRGLAAAAFGNDNEDDDGEDTNPQTPAEVEPGQTRIAESGD